MKYNSKCILYCLLTAISCFYSCPKLSAQGRSDKIKARYAYLINQAEQAYQAYDFELAETSINKYKQKLKQRRISLDSLTLNFEQKIQRTKHLLSYAEYIQLVDSVQFPKQDIEQVISQRSSTLAKILSFKIDSTDFKVTYKTEVGGFTIYSGDKQVGNADLYRRELSSLEEPKAKHLSESVNTEEDEFNPFLLSSGYTLIFARESKEGIGGTDLYYTRYNTEEKTFYKAKMLGMPFNSIYNDYLFAYDDKQNLSYLVSERFCPKDSLVLYRFVGLPKVIAENGAIAGANVTANEEANGLFSNILDSSYRMPSPKAKNETKMRLPLKDGIEIRSWEGFRSHEALSYYRDYIAYGEQLKEQKQYQKELRQRYRKGDRTSSQELLELEQAILELQRKQNKTLIECKNAEIKCRQNNI